MKQNTTHSAALAAIAFAILAWAFAPAAAFAAGTPAGTSISNMATVNFNAGANARTEVSDVVTLHVGHKVVASFAPSSGSSTGVDDRTIYVPITFTQTGNRWDQFAISIVKTGSTTGKYTVDMMTDADGNGSVDVSDVVITNSGAMAIDAERKMLLRIQVASETPDNDAVNIAVTFTSQAVNAGTDTVVVNKNAAFTYNYTYTVQKPVIAFSVAQVTDLTANSARIPGRQVTYRVSVQNTGHAAPTSTSEIHWQYDASLLNYTSTTGTAIADSASGSKVFTLTAAQLPASMAGALTFDVIYTIDQAQHSSTGVTAGTDIFMNDPTNGARVYLKYAQGSDNVKWYDASGGTKNFQVGTASGVAWTATPSNGSGNPGDVVEYQFTLTNTGNHDDTFNLTDALNAGGLDVAHVFAMASNGTGVTVTTTVAAGATRNVFVRVTVPLSATDAQTIRRNITAATATPSADAPVGGATSASYTGPLVTVVKAPVIAVTLTDEKISGTGTAENPAPDDVIRWTVTITNNGTGDATSISSSNMGYAHTGSNTFVASSVDIDPLGNNAWSTTGLDNTGTFSGGTVSVSNGVVTVTFGSIPSHATVKYRYSVLVH